MGKLSGPRVPANSRHCGSWLFWLQYRMVPVHFASANGSRTTPNQPVSCRGVHSNIWLGANDAAVEESIQAVPLERFRANITFMVEMLKLGHATFDHGPRVEFEFSPVSNILLVTPPPVDAEAWSRSAAAGGGCSNSSSGRRREERSAQYAACIREIAVQLKVPCLDLYACFDSVSNWKSLLSDGLHLSQQGHLHYATWLSEMIYKLWPHFKNKGMSMPLHRDIDCQKCLLSQFFQNQ